VTEEPFRQLRSRVYFLLTCELFADQQLCSVALMGEEIQWNASRTELGGNQKARAFREFPAAKLHLQQSRSGGGIVQLVPEKWAFR
jgi:hypothetical protein